MNDTNTTPARSEIQNTRISRAALGETIGTRNLSAWQTAPGHCWIQSRSPAYARKLARRSDAQLVAVGVAGGFLRTFCFRHSLTWARKLIARYTRNDVCANDAKTAPESPAEVESAEVRDKYRAVQFAVAIGKRAGL